ncbi:hypothetical protein Lgee_0811 [Legionella geestiana]|uniref:Uncharacterized protein n=1 Tax=Legionella geestiana TaxID=45065 RepID=A0A0W0U2T8_9GAMM|nr:hypothetical protein Lgee_0811 [Legionella geestiana]STX54623.1 Uncharacterised protein [Legionella geestiana]
MILLDNIEQAIGTEYFGDTQCAELCAAIQTAETDADPSFSTSQQPHSNKIVHVH